MSSEGYPPDWDTRRKEVYQRDDHTCQNCGVKGGQEGRAELHAHHIVPKSKGGTHKKSNLKTICKECHNAIHGDSMARSVDVEQNTQLEYPVDIEKFPYTVSEYVECLNTLAEVQNGFNESAKISDELVEYASAYQELDGNVPDRVERSYTNTKEEANSVISEVQENITTLQDTDYSEFDSSTENELSTFIDVADDLITNIQEYIELVDEMATGEPFTESDYSELQFLSDEISETNISGALSSVSDCLNTEMDQKLAHIDKINHWSDKGFNTIEICPLCESETEHLEYSNDRTGFEFKITRCGSCKAEWVVEDRIITMTNNSDGIEEVSLDPVVWTRIRKDESEMHKKVGYYQNLSNNLVRKRKTMVYASAGIFPLSAILALIYQSLGLFFAGAAISVIILVTGPNLLNYQMKS